MKVGSLFSGIGGFELGFERAGFEVAWQVEIDPWCRKVLAKHWPSVPRYEDVREVGAHNLAPVDVIIGGFPCQDISAAGKGAGIDGERSGLWREYARLIDELRPRYAVMENVGALLYRGLGRVLGDLAEIGYDADWQILPASAFGAPHRRERIWIVAYPTHQGVERGSGQRTGDIQQGGRRDHRRAGSYALVGQGHTQPCLAHAESARPRRLPSRAPEKVTVIRSSGQHVANPERIRLEEPGHPGIPGRAANPITNSGWWAVEPPVGRVANGVPRRVDRLRGLGNAVVPQVAQYVAECVMAHATAQEAQAA